MGPDQLWVVEFFDDERKKWFAFAEAFVTKNEATNSKQSSQPYENQKLRVRKYQRVGD